MKRASLFVVVFLASGIALAQETAVNDAKPAAEQAKDKVETVAAVDAQKVEEFVPPAGYKAKRRGKITLYCIEDSTVGTRFKTQKCYDEAQMRDVILSRELNNRDFDQRRAICSNPAICRIE